MLWSLKSLLLHCQQVSTEIDGQWVPARTWRVPFSWRLRAAWLVLIGRADAVTWPGGQ